MADEAGSEEKTEEATAQRREDFRRQGQVVQSREIASVIVLLGSALLMWGASRFFFQQIEEVYKVLIGAQLASVVRTDDIFASVRFAAEKAALLSLPILLGAAILSFLSSVVQIGFLYNEEAVSFNLDKLDPVEGFKKLFNLRAIVEGLKAILKLAFIAGVAWVVLRSEFQNASLLMGLSVTQLVTYVGTIAFKLILSVGGAMGGIAILDYGYLRWELERKMRMTKQEVREEHKAREGDPLVKSRIRRIQREIANKRMMEDVPKADVVITNPTHIAIALKYDDTLPAPKIVAKGAGLIAEKIKELAKQHQIPVVENKPLARTIYKTLKIGQLIPRELYQAVAEVLAYVYKLKRKVFS